jgi:hypothetical protein
MRFLLFLLSAAPAAAQLPRLTPAVTIGCADCEGPEAFGAIQAIALGPGGTIVVADRDPPILRVFGVDGRLRWAGATAGDGPGEQCLVIGVGVTADAGVVSLDMRQLRVSRYDRDRRFMTSHQLSIFPLALGYHPTDDRVLITAEDFRDPGGVVLWLRDGRADTLLSPLPFAGRQGHQFASPAVRSDGAFAMGEGRELYHVSLRARDGTLLRTLVRDIPRTRRTPDEMAAAERRMMRAGARRSAEGGSGAGPMVDPWRSHFTALDALAFDDQDRLWVRTERGGPGRSVFDLFSREGVFLGEIPLDAEVDHYRVSGGFLAGVIVTEDGTQRVRIWRLDP